MNNTTIPQIITNATTAILTNQADTSWMLISSILVMLMTPALGFFYGGLVKTHNMMSMLGQCLTIYATITGIWTLFGFSMVFSKTSNSGLIGGFDNAALVGVDYTANPDLGGTIPFLLFFFFQLQFACITPALIIGATAERVRYKPLMIFCIIWHILVYCPVAHWNWNPKGWLFLLGTKDFAGGNAIHISAGISAMAVTLFLENEPLGGKKLYPKPQNLKRRRVTFGGASELASLQDEVIVNFNFSKNSLVFLVIGTMLLWFGWFGFNAGSSLNTGSRAILAAVNTNVAPAISLMAWVVLDLIYKGRPTVSGMCIAIVCGLVGITPAAGFVRVWAAVVIGIFATLGPYYFCLLRDTYKLFDDRLDVFGCHGVGGIVGGILLGFFYCDVGMDQQCDATFGIGAVYGDGTQLAYQFIGIFSTIAYSFVMTYGIIYLMSLVMEIALTEHHEVGVDKLDYDEYGLPLAQIRKN